MLHHFKIFITSGCLIGMGIWSKYYYYTHIKSKKKIYYLNYPEDTDNSDYNYDILL